uniref:Uncharacterized protein n=1 Tax=Coccidioides posadasii RMSCC 3488 TaxID=454284 RepID=A0A0J6FB31_COCPO|nr:hypothetical protein CPAG_02469 [Coccidioides posadasii RMSCC 3488]
MELEIGRQPNPSWNKSIVLKVAQPTRMRDWHSVSGDMNECSIAQRRDRHTGLEMGAKSRQHAKKAGSEAVASRGYREYIERGRFVKSAFAFAHILDREA